MPDEVRDLPVVRTRPGDAPRLVFSALPSAVAGELEHEFAAAGHLVLSNASNHRMQPLVPLLIPEVNPEHLSLVAAQRRANGGRGAIVTNPNCSTVMLTMALAALRRFSPTRVMVSTLQAASGAGYPGVASLDLLGNVIPVVKGEEEKLETETKKILGTVRSDRVEPHPVTVSAQTTRVAVVDGHTELVAVALERAASVEEVREAFGGFSGRPQEARLPSAPSRPILLTDLPDRPQPRLDVDRERGMSVHVGRVRPCRVLDFKFVVMGHNTVRGAAGASVLNAELMASEGWLD
jgi:aspartate-semialdehyde dehydrogenase